MPVREYIALVLIQAKERLTSRLQRAVEDQEFSDVAQLASVLRQIQELIPGDSDANFRHEPAETYPRFLHADGRLVKIGWSNKSGAEYEHRAPEAAVLAVASALRALGSDEFTVAKMLPVRDEGGKIVPRYQVQLVIAWLHASGAVRKEGNGIYVAISEALTVAAVNELWVELHEAASGGTSIDGRR